MDRSKREINLQSTTVHKPTLHDRTPGGDGRDVIKGPASRRFFHSEERTGAAERLTAAEMWQKKNKASGWTRKGEWI
jgi:hypothetical protein